MFARHHGNNQWCANTAHEKTLEKDKSWKKEEVRKFSIGSLNGKKIYFGMFSTELSQRNLENLTKIKLKRAPGGRQS